MFVYCKNVFKYLFLLSKNKEVITIVITCNAPLANGYN